MMIVINSYCAQSSDITKKIRGAGYIKLVCLTGSLPVQLTAVKKMELVVSPDTGTSHKILKNRVQMRIPD